MRTKLEFVEMRPPLGDLSPEELAKTLDEIGATAREKFETTTNELLELLRRKDPIAILSRMGWRFFAVQASESDEKHWPASEQHHLELLQALALRASPPEAPEPSRLADVVQTIAERLDVNTQAFNLSRFKAPKAGAEEKARRQASLIEQIRGDTQFVRGEFLPDQLDRYLRAILRRIDDDFSAVHGITGSALLDTLHGLLGTIENKLNTYRMLGRKVIRSYKAEKAVKAYFDAFPEEIPHRDLILADAAAKQVKPHQMRLFLVEEAERLLPEVFSFNDADVQAACPPGANVSAARQAIEIWSLSFGDLSDRPVDHLYLANPVWDRPLIKLTNGRFFWPSPATSLSFRFEMFERLITANAELVKKYEAARSETLEEELGLLLKRYFHSGRVLEQIKWTSPLDQKGYENDAVVVIDRTALIFEAKSGKVSVEARRGADRRLKREIAKLMVEPAEQSRRLMELLSSERRVHSFQTKYGEQAIDSCAVDQFIRVNVTFNIIGALSSRWPDLVDAELIEAGTVQIPTMSIADLDVVCDALREQATITHYLHRRTEFEANAVYYADEYDLLSFYLKTGFNIGETEFDGTVLMIYGMSDDLNAHYKRQSEKQRPSRPRPQRTKLFARIISALEERQPERWLEACDRLLNVAMTDQETIEQSFSSSAAKVRNSRDANMSWSARLANGPPQRRQAISIVWYRFESRLERQSALRSYAAGTMDMAGTKDCLVVGFDVTHPTEPYSVIALIK